MDNFLAYLRNKLLQQWILWNAAGWIVGLVFGGSILALALGLALSTQSRIPYVGIAVAGAVVGAAVGTAQRIVLQPHIRDIDQRWVHASMIGGAVGAFPAILASFITQASWLVGFGAVGAIFGVAMGFAQWRMLREHVGASGAKWWLAAYALGGLLCAEITVPPHYLLLPLCCPLGTLVLGAVTGVAVVRTLSGRSVEVINEEVS